MSARPTALLDAWTRWEGAVECAETGRCWTAASLRAAAERLAADLAESGVEAGALVALLVSNTAAFPTALMALLLHGAHPVLCPANIKSVELSRDAKRCGFRWALHDFGHISGLDSDSHCVRSVHSAAGAELSLLDLGGDGLVPALGSAGVVLHSTSGTYGHASFCIRNQDVAVAEAENFLERITPYRRARVRMTTPLSHAYAYGFGWVASLLSDSTLVLASHFNAKSVLAAEHARPSDIVALVPPMARAFVSMASREDSPRFAPCVFYAGAPCPDPVLKGFEATFPSRVFAIYGSTETGAICSNFSLDSGAGSGVGRPLAGVSISVDQPEAYASLGAGTGEICVRSTSMMQGYFGPSTRWTSDGAFPTGDVGRLVGEDVVLLARMKEVVNLGGLKVDPAEVEAVLMAHPAVADAAVYPGRAGDRGEFVQAAVVLSSADCTVDALRRHCVNQLAEHKVPVAVHVVDSLPRTASGKCLKIRCPGFPALS